MTGDRLQRPVLVLNASYEPINVCAARRALVRAHKILESAGGRILGTVVNKWDARNEGYYSYYGSYYSGNYSSYYSSKKS